MVENQRSSDDVLIVWQGEWPRVKYAVCRATRAVRRSYHSFITVYNVPQHIRDVRKLQQDTHSFVSKQTRKVHTYVRQSGASLAPSAFIASLSFLVTLCSRRWGVRVMLWNGALTSVGLTFWLLSRSTVSAIDGYIPYSSSVVRAAASAIDEDSLHVPHLNDSVALSPLLGKSSTCKD